MGRSKSLEASPCPGMCTGAGLQAVNSCLHIPGRTPALPAAPAVHFAGQRSLLKNHLSLLLPLGDLPWFSWP